MTVSRRRFLGGLASVAALPTLARGRALGGRQPAEVAADFFRDDDAARRIGQVYLDTVPAEADAATLRALIAPEDIDPEEWWATVSLRALRKQVRRRVRADFAGDGVVFLDGWVLAATEARLAAIVTLVES